MDLARAPRRAPLTARKKGSGYENAQRLAYGAFTSIFNLVPRACDPREGNEGSGIIRFREDSDWPLKYVYIATCIISKWISVIRRLICLVHYFPGIF